MTSVNFFLSQKISSCDKEKNRFILLSSASLLALAVSGFPAAALPVTETASGLLANTTPMTTIVPNIPLPAGTPQTLFTGYIGGSYRYTLFPFTVTTSGTYSAVVTTTLVTNTSWFLTGLFSPSAPPTPPTTPLSNIFSGIFAGSYPPYTDTYNSLTLAAGTQYSMLLAYNIGAGPTTAYSFSMTGPGCASIIASCASEIMPSSPASTADLGGSVIPAFRGGTLSVATSGQTYGQDFTLDGSSGNTIDQASKTATFSGVFSDAVAGSAGGIIIANSGAGGAVTFTGANTYTGATTINSGATLALAGAGSIASSSGVEDNGTFDISGTPSGASITRLSGNGSVALGLGTLTLTAAADTFTGTINGAGGLTIGAGTETLTGASTYAGPTTINSGATLALAGSGSIASSSGVADNGTFDISGKPSGTSITRLSGNGSVVLGSGTLTLTAAADTFSGTINGAGGLTIGGGTETLTGANTYTGPTTIGQGAELFLLGSLAAPVTVNTGGVLRGTGSVGGAVSVASGGTLAVGATPGQLTVSAPVTLAAGSTLSFDIDGATAGSGAGHYSTLSITGAGNGLSAGGTLVPILRGITGSATNSFTPAIGQQFMVVTAPGGISGSFSGLTQPAGLAAGTRFDAVYGPTSLNFVITPSAYGNLPLAGLAETPNQAAIGRVLDSVRPAAGTRLAGGAAGVFGSLYALPGAAIAPALDQLSPSIYAEGLMAARQSWYAMTDAVTDQLAARRSGIGTGRTTAGPNGSTIWISGIGQFTDVSSAGTPGYRSSLGGAVAGIDIPVMPNTIVGASVGGGSTTTSSSGATVTGTAVQFTLYGGLQQGLMFVDGQAAYMHSDQDARRSATLFGTAAKANGDIGGGGAQMRGGLHLGYGGWQIEPSIGLSVMSLTQDDLNESTGGSASERIRHASITSMQSLASVRVGTQFAITPAVPIAVHALLGWQHEYLDVAAHSSATFAFAPTASFGAASAPIARDAARLGAGFDVPVTPAVSLFANYQAELGRASSAQNLTGGVRVVW